MCSSGNILGALAGVGLAYATGGLSVAAAGTGVGGFTLGSIASAAALGSSVGGAVTAPKVASPKAVDGAPNPAVDQAAAQDAGRIAATQRRRALGAGTPRSLLATIGGAQGDTSAAQVGSAAAAPIAKQTLGS